MGRRHTQTALPGATDFDRVIDIRDFAFDPHFRQVAMIDYFLLKLGVDPASVVPAERRNAWLAPRVSLPEVANEQVLVCPMSKPPRATCPRRADAVLDWSRQEACRCHPAQPWPRGVTLPRPST